MISSIDKVTLNVRDQDAALTFWTETIGFRLVRDSPMSDDPSAARWIEVRPPSGDALLVLFRPAVDEAPQGNLSHVLFACDDIEATYKELTARGVEFPDPPVRQPWGWWAAFKDNEGNLYGLGQRDGS